MNALIQKKQEWERQNQQVLLRLVQSSSEVSLESVKAAGFVTSFILYLVYILIRGILALGSLLIRGPQMVRQVGPGHKPLEYHEFNEPRLGPAHSAIRQC